MANSPPTRNRICFGSFEADLAAGQLRHDLSGQAVAEVALLRIAAGVDERNHRDPETGDRGPCIGSLRSLGAVALRTGSTLASIAMHAGVNAVPLLLPARLVRIDGFNTLTERVEHISPVLLLASLAGLAIALRLIWRATDDAQA